VVVAGFDKQINKLKLVRAKYLKLTSEEDAFFAHLEARVEHLALIQDAEQSENLG
jgi:hypothetical protein